MSDINLNSWADTYAPKTLETYVASPSLLQKMKFYIEKSAIPNLLFSGPSGTGKTTLAKLLTSQLPCDVKYINASDENSIDVIRDKVKSIVTSIGFKPFKVVIFDEADYITKPGQYALRNVIDMASNTKFIFTCNYPEKIIEPIKSRLQHYIITPPSKKDAAILLKKILVFENVHHTDDDIIKLINFYYPDLRSIINGAERNTISNQLKIDESLILDNDTVTKLIQILKSRKSKLDILTQCRQHIANNIVDFTEVYRALFDNVDALASDYSKAEIILAIAEGFKQDSEVIDKEINFVQTIIHIINILYKG